MKKQSLSISIIITIIYGILTLFCVLHHEIWADEAQVWQLCKYLSLPELSSHLHNEGHPILLYLLTMPFAKIFPTALPMQLMCWGAMVISVFLLMRFSPFKLYSKLAIIFSAGFIYFLPVIARNYSIIPLLVFLLAILYEKRDKRPYLYAFILACLANTHIIMFAFCSILFIFFFYENIIKNNDSKKRFILPCLIVLLGLCACVLQLYNTTSSNYFISFSNYSLFAYFLRIMENAILNLYDYNFEERPYISIHEIIIGLIMFVSSALIFKSLFPWTDL